MTATITRTGAFIIAQDSLVVVIGGVNYTISKTSALYQRVKDAVVWQNWDDAQSYLEQATSLKGEIWWNEAEGAVFYGQEPLHHALADRLPRMIDEGFDTAPMIAFLKNLFLNPAVHAIEELYEFMERNALPITEDGCFLAYKKVNEDYTDCHTHTVDNSVGQKPFMDRSKCDPIRTNHCSTGYHFCGLSYLSCFGGERVMIVKINPADVTSIPNDYNFAKGRCNTYEVISEYGGTDVQRYDAFTSSVAPADWNEGEDDWDEDRCPECNSFNCQCQDEDPEPEAEDAYGSEGCTCDQCQDNDSVEPDEPNLFTPATEADYSCITNPITKARVRAGLDPAPVAEALGMTTRSYVERVEVEGRFFKPSTVGRILHTIEVLANGWVG